MVPGGRDLGWCQVGGIWDGARWEGLGMVPGGRDLDGTGCKMKLGDTKLVVFHNET